MRVWLVAAVALATGLGCSAVVDPDDSPLLCAVGPGEPDPCPRGLACIAGQCRMPGATMDGGPCTATGEERCNGLDDDCDDVVDEGHDVDGDGFTWCGGGVLTLADCDDSDPSVHPADPGRGIAAGTEMCDGTDNNCDGTIDESGDPPICPAGLSCIDRACVDPDDCTQPGNECGGDERCDVSLDPPTCVPGGCVSEGCPSGQVCDEATRSCVTLQPLGMPCVTHGECESNHCAPKEALGLGGAEERICTAPCCSDADCAPDALCWASGTGARLCVPGELIGGQRGGGGPGGSCASGSECQSGLCFTGVGECLANCSHEDQCASDQTCTLFGPFDRGDVSNHYQVICVEPAGSRSVGQLCDSGSDCRSGVCIGFQCSASCSTTADCGSSMYCTFLVPNDAPDRFLQLCYPRIPFGGHGDGRTGESCGSNGDCVDDACVRNVCADTCCNDSSCGGGTSCRPIRFGADRYEMHCTP